MRRHIAARLAVLFVCGPVDDEADAREQYEQASRGLDDQIRSVRGDVGRRVQHDLNIFDYP
jgi:hypothetical protein